MQEIPRFTVHSFNYTVNIDLNLEAALCLYKFIHDTVEVDPVLYAMSKKIKHQFYRMKKLHLIGEKDDVRSDPCIKETGTPVCGTVNGQGTDGSNV